MTCEYTIYQENNFEKHNIDTLHRYFDLRAGTKCLFRPISEKKQLIIHTIKKLKVANDLHSHNWLHLKYKDPKLQYVRENNLELCWTIRPSSNIKSPVQRAIVTIYIHLLIIK